MSDTITRYIIELEDGGFADFDQISNEEVMVNSQGRYELAHFFCSESEAKKTVDEMNKVGNVEWIYSGWCTKPKAVHKIKIEFVGEVK